MKLLTLCNFLTLMLLQVRVSGADSSFDNVMGSSGEPSPDPNVVANSLPWYPGSTGRDTCQEQLKVVSFTVERQSDAANACHSGCGQMYKVCLTLLLNQTGDNYIKETCIKDPANCSTTNFSDWYYTTYNYSASGVGLAHGTTSQPADPVNINGGTQCQIGAPGQFVDFLLDDGQCWVNSVWQAKDYADYAEQTVSGSGYDLTFQCHSRKYWNENLNASLGTCSCRALMYGCVWRVQLPPCPESPPPACSCPPLNEECQGEIQTNEETKGYDHHFEVANCSDPHAVAEHLNEHGLSVENRSYGCQESTLPNCNNIFCERYVPPSAYDDLSTCALPSPSPTEGTSPF